MKLTKYQAEQVIEAWKADGLYGAVSECLQDEVGYFPYVCRIRVLIGGGNTLANNALWEKKWTVATGALMKYGIEKGSAGQRGRASLQKIKAVEDSFGINYKAKTPV